MLSILTKLHHSLRQGLINKATTARYLSRGTVLFDVIEDNVNILEEVTEEDNEAAQKTEGVPVTDIRVTKVPVEQSIRYLASEAYKITYGDEPVWKPYRRNFKGQIAPEKTREKCWRNGVISTGNPCPICRDEYLVLDHRNVALLNQFISPHNRAILTWNVTNICRRQHQNLLIAIYRAKKFGTITFDVPFREYDYSEWYKPEAIEKSV